MKKQPATAILGTALNSYGLQALHNYMRVHRGKEFRAYARRYVAAASASGKRYVAQQLFNNWAKWMETVQYTYRHLYDEKAKDYAFFAEYASPEFLAQFPANLAGYTQSQGEYWYERMGCDTTDRSKYKVTVESTLMGPRLMKGAEVEMQRVLSKREIQPGRVYGYWNGHYWDVFRVLSVKGRKVITCYDKPAVDDGGLIVFPRKIGDLFDKARRGHKVLAQFVRYTTNNPAWFALAGELNKHIERKNEARRQKAKNTEQQLADALRRIAELEGSSTTQAPAQPSLPTTNRRGRQKEQRHAAAA